MLSRSATFHWPALTVGLTVAVTSLLYLFVFRKRKNFVSVCKVEKLFIYPIKGVKGVEVDRVEITGNVFKYGKFRDRSWVILDNENKVIYMADEPRLALTKTSFDGNDLLVEAPDMPILRLSYIEDLNDSNVIRSVKINGQEIKGIDCGEYVNQWFRTFLNRPSVRLLQYHDSFKLRDTHSDERRNDDKKFPVIYQNKSGFHLVNQSSIEDLNRHFPEGKEGVVVENFRPNIVVNYPKPWDEDMWQYMSINGVLFMRLVLCNRCAATQVNQREGVRGQPTLATLRKLATVLCQNHIELIDNFRLRPPQGLAKKKGLGPDFGVIYGTHSKGFISVNDQIEVVYGENDVN